MHGDVNAEGPTVGVVCYGSLLSPDELVPFLDGDGSRAVTVRVDGFRRAFNQRSVWRAGASNGDGFYDDFLDTTYVDDDRKLREYIDTGFAHGSF